MGHINPTYPYQYSLTHRAILTALCQVEWMLVRLRACLFLLTPWCWYQHYLKNNVFVWCFECVYHMSYIYISTFACYLHTYSIRLCIYQCIYIRIYMHSLLDEAIFWMGQQPTFGGCIGAFHRRFHRIAACEKECWDFGLWGKHHWNDEVCTVAGHQQILDMEALLPKHFTTHSKGPWRIFVGASWTRSSLDLLNRQQQSHCCWLCKLPFCDPRYHVFAPKRGVQGVDGYPERCCYLVCFGLFFASGGLDMLGQGSDLIEVEVCFL